MDIIIQTPHFTARKELIDFANEKIGRLGHLYQKLAKADACLKLDKSDTRENKVCEIRLSVPGKDLFASRSAQSFEEAIVMTVDALQKQVEKMKSGFEIR